MSIVKRSPNTIRLSGDGPIVNTESGQSGGGLLGVAAIPGMLMESYAISTGVDAWRPNTSATNDAEVSILLNEPTLNRGIDTPSPIGELPQIWKPRPGSTFFGILVSGANAANSSRLQSNGDGKLKVATSVAASAGVAKFKCLDNVGAVVVDTRVRVEVLSA